MTSRHPGAVLLMSCAGPERARQIADWRRRAPRLTVTELDCGHFETFGSGHTSTVLRHLDTFIDTCAGVSGTRHLAPEGTR
ncbi:hypothetical protein ACFVYR_20095 [Streptomyces sp. NPDC058284]|uniref:hypothetical protein n=1 Tax=unclassified Streptomyces TaxID=2593676 RepID=UPI0036550742